MESKAARARHDFANQYVIDLLGNLDREISLDQAEVIVEGVCSQYGVPPILIRFSDRFKSCWGRAYKKTRTVSLCVKHGRSVSCLLHEIAHLLPESYNHSEKWQGTFILLVKWYIHEQNYAW